VARGPSLFPEALTICCSAGLPNAAAKPLTSDPALPRSSSGRTSAYFTPSKKKGKKEPNKEAEFTDAAVRQGKIPART
jgi:hypothetical protein